MSVRAMIQDETRSTEECYGWGRTIAEWDALSLCTQLFLPVGRCCGTRESKESSCGPRTPGNNETFVDCLWSLPQTLLENGPTKLLFMFGSISSMLFKDFEEFGAGVKEMLPGFWGW